MAGNEGNGMKLTVTVATDGQTTLDVYDVCQAIITELETVKRFAGTVETVEEIGSLGKIGVARREDGPSGKWKLELE